MATLVQLQRWWRRCLLKLYENKVKKLSEQQHMLETKIAIIKAQLVDPLANLPSTSLYDGLEMLHEQPTEDINLWMNEHEKLRSAVFEQLQAIKTSVQSAQPSPAVTPVPPTRPIKALTSKNSMPERSSALPSPCGSTTSMHQVPTSNSLQESLEGMEKSFHILLRVMRVVFSGKKSDNGQKVPSSIIVSHQIQQTIVRLLSEIHERLDDTIQIHSTMLTERSSVSLPPPTPSPRSNNAWKTISQIEPVLPYAMGSAPWNRLFHDWSQGSEHKVAALHRWLETALHKPTDMMKPIELQCLHPVVLEGFLKLVVPTIKMKHSNLVVQTKPLTGAILRLHFQPTPTSPGRNTVYNMQGTMVAAGGRMRRKLHELSVVSFNLLAPCYFRHGGRLEATDSSLYMRRLQALVSPLKAEKSSVMCLQEYWFKDEYMKSFESHFPGFSCHLAKRPGLKEDGLAIFIDESKLTIHNFTHLDFDKAGDRVAMLMHLSIQPDLLESHTHSFMERSFLLINTHLTFPHSDINRLMRMSQIQTMLKAVQDYQEKEHLENCPVVMCGDFNDIYDPVHDLVIENGFRSVFSYVHGREAKITHCNHNNSEVGVDFIFCSNPFKSFRPIKQDHVLYNEKRLLFKPKSCDLLPRSLPDATRLKRPEFLTLDNEPWDENQWIVPRPLDETVDYWRMVSDHRPLVATFDVSTNKLW
ncbi:hypothetical protein THRCLA_06138 [Thraustotheca clavata]|uniref:Uncharacterized protein n=1 Tax=Thraustotheca clavata TaxID=74557 RepID=A0A1V9ZQA9_9STRA|nr:hypothetical protein THRCLA_06138 [Thraustotheca clavata]